MGRPRGLAPPVPIRTGARRFPYKRFPARREQCDCVNPDTCKGNLAPISVLLVPYNAAPDTL